MTYFTETQRFRQPWIIALIPLILITSLGPFLYGIYRQIILHQPFGDSPAPDRYLIITTVAVAALVFGIVWLLLASYLRVEVQDEALSIRFFPFIRERRIAFRDIAQAEARTYSPLMEYGGWGVRFGPHGKAYNVSGNRGVQLELAGGERLLLGSQRADELAAAIGERIGQH